MITFLFIFSLECVPEWRKAKDIIPQAPGKPPQEPKLAKIGDALYRMTTTLDSKEDAEGHMHSESNGQFVSRGGGEGPGGRGHISTGKSNLNQSVFNAKMYDEMTNRMKKEGLLKEGNSLEPPVHIAVKVMTPHAMRHGVNQEMAQHYIDTAIVRIRQSDDKFSYISDDGTAVIIDSAGRVVSAWSFKDYGPNHMKLWRELKEWKNQLVPGK